MKNYWRKKVVCTLCALMVVSQIGIISQANNYKDTSYSFSYNGDGSDVSTSARAKKDKSASYVNNNGSNTTTISVAVAGSKNGGHTTALSGYYNVKKGNRKYMKNQVYQKGYRQACLLMSTANHSKHKIQGKWSPDNCSGY